MNRLEVLMGKEEGPVLNVYCTAGYPQKESTCEVLEALQEAGASMVEIGMPYSDPLADGPVIQHSSAVALHNGMNIPLLLEQIKSSRKKVHLPIVLMGYLNPVIRYGFSRFCAHAADAGVDGLIIPDMPAHAYAEEYREAVEANGLCFSFLITPETSEARIRRLDSLSSGFLYAVSSSSLTGAKKDFSEISTYLGRLQSMSLQNPILVGFGIRDRASYIQASSHARGAIIGSAYIEALGRGENILETTKAFISSILQP